MLMLSLHSVIQLFISLNLHYVFPAKLDTQTPANIVAVLPFRERTAAHPSSLVIAIVVRQQQSRFSHDKANMVQSLSAKAPTNVSHYSIIQRHFLLALTMLGHR